jgi:predicted transcriptional regulator
VDEGGSTVAQKELLDKISIYVPKSKLDQKPVQRLMRLAETKDRSVNYLVVEAIVEYLAREEKRKN